MTQQSYANIHRTASFIPAARAAFGFVAVAAGLMAAVGFAGRIDGALGHRSAGLSLNLRNHLGHSVLGLGAGRNWGGWQRRYLHRLTEIVNKFVVPSLTKRNEEIFKHLVADSGLEKGRKNNHLAWCAQCKVVVL